MTRNISLPIEDKGLFNQLFPVFTALLGAVVGVFLQYQYDQKRRKQEQLARDRLIRREMELLLELLMGAEGKSEGLDYHAAALGISYVAPRAPARC